MRMNFLHGLAVSAIICCLAAITESFAQPSSPDGIRMFVDTGWTGDQAQITPDGEHLVELASDTRIAVREMETGRLVNLLGGRSRVWWFAVLPDSLRILVQVEDEGVRLWNLLTGVPEGGILWPETMPIRSIALAPDGAVFAVADYDEQLQLVNLAGEIVRRFDDAAPEIVELAFSADGGMLAALSSQGKTQVWNVASGKLLAQLPLDGETPDGIAFLPGGDALVLTFASHAEVRRVGDGSRIRHFDTTERQVLAATKDGRFIAHIDFDQPDLIRLWDTSTGEIASLEAPPPDTAALASPVLSSPGSTLLGANYGNLLAIHDLRSLRMIRSLSVPPALAPVDLSILSPDGRLLAMALRSGEIRLWSLGTGEPTATLAEPPARSAGWWHRPASLGFSADGNRISVLYSDGRAAIYDSRSGEQVGATIDAWPETEEKSGYGDVALTPAGDAMVVKEGEAARFFDSTTGGLVAEVDGLGEPIRDVAFSPVDPIATIAFEKRIDLFDWSNGKISASFGAGIFSADFEIKSARFMPDGQSLVVHGAPSYSSEQALFVVEIASGSILSTFRADELVCWGISADQGILVAGPAELKRFDLKTSEVIRLSGGEDRIPLDQCQFAEAGKRLVYRNAAGETVVASAADFSEQARFFDGNDGSWLTLAANGTFSGQGEMLARLIAYEGSKRVDPESLSARFRQPALVAEALNTGTRVEAVRESSRAADFLGPAVTPPQFQEFPKGDLRIVANQAHAYSPDAFALTLDRRLLVTASSDKLVKLWDVRSGQLIRTYSGATDSLRSVAIAPDGSVIAAGAENGRIHLWRSVDGERIGTLDAHDQAVETLAWSPDGLWLASGSEHSATGDAASDDPTLILWRTEDWTKARRFEYRFSAKSLRFLPDARHLAILSEDRLTVWDAVNDEMRRDFPFSGWLVDPAMALSPDGRMLALQHDYSVDLYDVDTGLVRSMSIAEGRLQGVAFSNDGAMVLAGSADGTFFGWDVRTGRLVVRQKSADGSTAIELVAAMPDDDRLLVKAPGGVVEIRSIRSGEIERTMGFEVDSVETVQFLPDGVSILAGGQGTIALWNIGTGDRMRTYPAGPARVGAVSVSRDGSKILVGHQRRLVRLLDPVTGRESSRFEDSMIEVTEAEKADEIRRSFAEVHADIMSWAMSFAISSEGRQAALGRHDGLLKIFDPETGTLQHSIEASDSFVAFVTFAPDGRSVVSGGGETVARLWDTATGKLIRAFEGHAWAVRAGAFDAEGKRLLTGSGDRTLILWDVASGTPIRRFAGHTDVVRAVAFFPDGKRAVSGGYDGTVRIWDLEEGTLLRTLEGHMTYVNSVAVSPDGHRIASASSDGTIRIWSADTGRLLATLISSTGGAWMALSEAGFVNADEDGANLLGVVDGLEVYGARQFYQTLYKPHLVEALLQGDPEGRHADAASRLDLRKVLDSGPPPEIRLDPKKTERTEETIRIALDISDRGGGIGRIEWRVNGLTLGIERGVSLLNRNGEAFSREIALVPGRNRIEVQAYNAAELITSEPLELTVDSAGVSEGRRGTLHVLAAAVNDYAEPRFRLSYARQDALAIATALKTSASDLFDDVQVRLALDGEVTREGLDAAFADIAGQAKPEDTFVFFLAGHGKTIANHYYFIPQDYHPGEGRTYETDWIGQDAWQEWFSRIAARKSVLIYDTCESETMTAAARGEDERQVALELLRHATGRSVISAARAAQPAFEGYRGHGLLTYVLLDAFANGDFNGNGYIETDELGRHAHERVPEISVAHYSVRQQPKTLISDPFPVGFQKPELAPDDRVAIPTKPTHVLLRTVAIITSRGTADPVELRRGAQVRLLEERDGQARIARNGVELGTVPADALLEMID